jgi:hypothetical protein
MRKNLVAPVLSWWLIFGGAAAAQEWYYDPARRVLPLGDDVPGAVAASHQSGDGLAATLRSTAAPAKCTNRNGRFPTIGEWSPPRAARRPV